MDPDRLARLHRIAVAYHEEELELLRKLARIPAPTGHEERRAKFVADWLRAQGAPRVEVTPEHNVLCLLAPDLESPDKKNRAAGDDTADAADAAAHLPAPDLDVFAAHLDVVFDDTDALPLHEDEHRIYAPGVGDDTANLVGLLMATKYLIHHPAALHGRHVLMVANVGEEGLGNLLGTKALFRHAAPRVRSFTTFDLYLPQCISVAVGSRRWRIRVRTQGGHSYQNFGRPNAVERLCALIEHLYHDPLPADLPARVTYNVGHIEGGTTVNAIAATAEVLYECRSTSEEALTLMAARLEKTIEALRVEDEEGDQGVEITVESIGVRPGNASHQPAAQTILSRLAARTVADITGEQPDTAPASTDANVPLSLGIPADCVGAVRGALLHTRDEWIDKDSLVDGLSVILSLMTEARHAEAQTR
ncbi:MAG: M20/M25/M40 family metallo-hydrolase [Olegusella sp.]|nr:M20/M25/M40 family metallo-hydrolase [Olegusella sp.]